ncbi:OsmC family protein [Lichenicoccus sp.]|uniref:OsmC family protein n=1 Tax=Lichenicoccus sp. TaxID=2781899 RepID=UPI003D0F8315
MIETNTPVSRVAHAGVQCRTVASGGSTNLNYVRDLAPIQVEERLGPPDKAPVATPFETLLAALGSCLASRIQANATLGNILVRELELVLDADIVTSSMWRAAIDVPRIPGLDAIRIKVHMDADASASELKTLIANSLMLSPVANVLHGPVDLDVALADPAEPQA